SFFRKKPFSILMGPAELQVLIRPYCLSTGQSRGPVRSTPTHPTLADMRQTSSKAVPGAKFTRIDPCLMRPLRLIGVVKVVWAMATLAVARADVVTKSRRRMAKIILPGRFPRHDILAPFGRRPPNEDSPRR